MVVGREYAYSLYIHCGVTVAQIGGRTFVDSPTGVRSTFFPDSGGHPPVRGTMTLVSHGAAVFHSDSGVVVPFIDHNPVVAGKAYTIDVAIGGPGRLDSTFFAGGLFASGEVLSGRLRLPSDASSVSGQMTLEDSDDARFSVGGVVVAYHRLSQAMCM